MFISELIAKYEAEPDPIAKDVIMMRILCAHLTDPKPDIKGIIIRLVEMQCRGTADVSDWFPVEWDGKSGHVYES